MLPVFCPSRIKQKCGQVKERNKERKGEVKKWTGSFAPMFMPEAVRVIKHDEEKQRKRMEKQGVRVNEQKQTIRMDETEQSMLCPGPVFMARFH